MWAVQLAFSPSADGFSGLTGLFCLSVITASDEGRAAGRVCVQQVEETTSMGFKILIVDDHEVVRQGIRTILRSRPQWEVCGEAVNGKDAIEKAKALDPDVIIMDITMPEMSGIEATREITKLGLRSAVLVFTMHESKNLSSTVQDAGARGFVLKSHAARDLLDAIDALLNGGTFFGADGKSSKGKEDASNRGMNFRVSLRVGWAL
jgi:CheY-like chemotaxis protein